jgi:LysM repeat protein
MMVMKHVRLLFGCLFLLVAGTLAVDAQTRMTPEEYIASHKDLAIREMKRMGVPASIKLAQGLLETEFGNSPLLKKSNNHFGIKCKSNWTGPGVSHDDDALGECFRVYTDAEASYRDHSNFLRSNGRYGFLFQLDPTDYKAWAHGLKKAGYATNPRYPEILIRNIEQYNLHQYTLMASNKVPNYDRSKYSDDPFVPAKPDTAAMDMPAVKAIAGMTRTSINGRKCIVAPAGTSLLAIATQQDIPLHHLLEYNDRQQDGILPREQPIYLEPKSARGPFPEYQVKAGETLYDIAQQYGMTISALASYNNLTTSAIVKPGQRLYLQPVKAVAAPQGGVQVHEVMPKEGLYGISRKYGVTVDQLKAWNNLQSDSLKIGQQLIVAQ